MISFSEFKEIAKGLYYKAKGECVFCKIVEENDPEKVIYQNETVAVFPPLKSDILAKGHLLVIPKEHHRDIFDLPEDTLTELTLTAKKVAETLEQESSITGFNILHASGKSAQQSVNHFHLHLVPRRDSDGLDLWPDTDYKEEEFSENYSKIRKALEDAKS
ncbi:MAG: histidine triad nucleotide-binding protein [Nanohaloarchaea archaeon SW_7_43_1]|nr:MAG: histidine triad nucleotide-binding protein [Nanohaloarchaea archaeon SW_7_43_1]